MNIREPIAAADIEEIQAKAKQYSQAHPNEGAYKAYYDGYTAAWLAARQEIMRRILG
jgi:hypothetical protein